VTEAAPSVLVRKVPGMIGPVFGRRSRWVVATAGGTTTGLTRLPHAALEPDPPPD